MSTLLAATSGDVTKAGKAIGALLEDDHIHLVIEGDDACVFPHCFRGRGHRVLDHLVLICRVCAGSSGSQQDHGGH